MPNLMLTVCSPIVRAFALIVLLCPLPGLASTPEVPHLSAYVTDISGTLSSSTISALNRILRQFEDSTSTQVVVLMMPTIGDEPLEDFSLKVVETNKIGQQGKDNGVLLLVAKNDRKIRIETGYGVEGALPDALAGLIINREITPRFRQGDYDGGIVAGANAIMLAVKNEYTAEPRKQRKGSSLGTVVLIVLIILYVVFSNRNRGSGLRGGPSPWILGGMAGMGRRGGGFGGGGFGGFSGGGFSGGGGSFGGGGASGGW
jgi:uncharacterized protein